MTDEEKRLWRAYTSKYKFSNSWNEDEKQKGCNSFVRGYEEGMKDMFLKLQDYLPAKIRYKNPVELVNNLIEKGEI